jgi:hypothetical protein
MTDCKWLAGAGIALLMAAGSTHAADSDFELWLNATVSTNLSKHNGLDFEAVQRFRDSSRGRPDTYFARLWLRHRASDSIRLAFGAERRVNDGAANETRLSQQATGAWGIWRARLRLEQRFLDGAERTSVRIRPRFGVDVPLDPDGRVAGFADAEAFFTLAPTSPGGTTGLTGLRTQIGLTYDASDRASLSLAWLRQQDINRGRADTIGHAPAIGVRIGF